MVFPNKCPLQLVLSTFTMASFIVECSQTRDLACEMFIAFDYPVYEAVFSEDLRNATMRAKDYVFQLNKIYHR